MARTGEQNTAQPPIKGSRRVANVLESLKASGIVPGYAPETVGAEAHKADEPGILWVEVDRILDSPYQHQEQLDTEDFFALIESIKSEGFLTALNVNQHPERAGYYFLTAGGHQRRDAAKAAGKSKIPVFVEPRLDPIRLAFRAAKENVVQVNRSPVNQGFLFLQMQDEFGLTQEEIAEELHRDRNYVKFCIMAARSAPDIQDMLTKKPDSLRAMSYLRRLDSSESRAPIIAQFLAGELTTEGVQAAVEHALQSQTQPISPPADDLVPEEFQRTDTTRTQQGDRGSAAQVQPAAAPPGGGSPATTPPHLSLPMKPASADQPRQGGAPAHAGGPAVAPTANDFQTMEREGKLKAIISRMETYKNIRGEIPLSARERAYLEQLAAMCQMLLGEY
jgi:ParB/RepB/Spo0J family partition protein